MRLWRNTAWDGTLLGLSIAHLVATLWVAAAWEHASFVGRGAGFLLLVAMTVYNVVVVSHLFTHQRWFRSPTLNRLVSMLNSVNIGQSVQTYELFHARNHHRYHNDPKGPDGATKDLSSTFRHGREGDHAGLFRYAFVGAAETLSKLGRLVTAAPRLWRVGEQESELRSLVSRAEGRRHVELRQVQLDRMARFAGLCLFLALDWQWVLLCYLPALYLSFALVNVQNYYEHYGASPTNRYANSVSHYGRLYNQLTFNDGYHQEHHLRPGAHWSRLPRLRRELSSELERSGRVVSPVPALLGFLRRNRPALAVRAATPRPEPGGPR